MTKSKMLAPLHVESKILEIRGERVMLDADLADVYGVTTRALNQAVKRNEERYPEDFAFQLTPQEIGNLKSQSVTSSLGHGGKRKPPWVFSEHGAVMVASVLNSPRAVEMRPRQSLWGDDREPEQGCHKEHRSLSRRLHAPSDRRGVRQLEVPFWNIKLGRYPQATPRVHRAGVAMLSSILRSKQAVAVNIEIMRAFVRIRELIAGRKDLILRLDALEARYDAQFRKVFDAIRALINDDARPRRRIGFQRGEREGSS